VVGWGLSGCPKQTPDCGDGSKAIVDTHTCIITETHCDIGGVSSNY